MSKNKLKKAFKHTDNLPDSFFGNKRAKKEDLPKVTVNPHFARAMKVCKDFGGETLIDNKIQYLDVGLEVTENPDNPKDYFLMLTVGKGQNHQHLFLSKKEVEKLKRLTEKFLKTVTSKEKK